MANYLPKYILSIPSLALVLLSVPATEAQDSQIPPTTLGQSDWVRPQSAAIILGQSGWVRPQRSAGATLGQSGWVQDMGSQYGLGNMMGFAPVNNMNEIGFPNQMTGNLHGATDNLDKAIGIASQLGIDLNQNDNTAGGAADCGFNYSQQRGLNMPCIPGTQLFNRTAERASHAANRVLDRILNRAINNFGR